LRELDNDDDNDVNDKLLSKTTNSTKKKLQKQSSKRSFERKTRSFSGRNAQNNVDNSHSKRRLSQSNSMSQRSINNITVLLSGADESDDFGIIR
jgi:hypothetical protein